jgi:hypothetical protein
MNYRRLYSNNKEPNSSVIYDQVVKLNNHYASLDYSLKIRRIKFKDPDTGKILVLLTNNFDLKATDIALVYKNRWEIELFFKWIKQHLKIKSFWGQPENAVKSQIWIAITVYALVAIAKKRFMIKQTLYEILQVLSILVFGKVPVNQLFAEYQLQYFKEHCDNQLKMLDL